MNEAAIGTCNLCRQGRLLIVRDNPSGEFYIYCEECEAEWPTPEASKEIETHTRFTHGKVVLVDREELVGHPWQAFLW